MPALPLTPSQKADASRLSDLLDKWKQKNIYSGLPSSQMYLASLLGFGQSALSQYRVGRIPLNVDALINFARVLDVHPSDISPELSREIDRIALSSGLATDESEHAPVRMVDAKASAGKGTVIFSTDVAKTLMFRQDFLRKNGANSRDVIAFPVTGNSMVDVHIVSGSVVIANTKRTEPLNKRFYVLWLNGELYVKQLVKERGQWFARSHNQAEASDNPDIQVDIDDRVVGRAFWCGFSL